MSALDELYGLGFDHHQKLEDGIKMITPDDIKRVASQYFQQPYILATVRPPRKT